MTLTLTSFSESPLHLLTIDEAEMLKNVVSHSVATALANRVFPVPDFFFNNFKVFLKYFFYSHIVS